MEITNEERAHLIRDKYNGDASLVPDEDYERISGGEPLAYVIGWIPFLGLKINLDSHPLIPRPETEWWTSELINEIEELFGSEQFHFLDLCAGSGAIGLAILSRFQNAQVTFSELVPEHAEQIRKNIELNGLEKGRARIFETDLFTNIPHTKFDFIASNPPYIPADRELEKSVKMYEPEVALFAGEDGLEVIERIAHEVKDRIKHGGQLWLEADTANVNKAAELLTAAGAFRADIRTDLYGRERLVLAFY